MKLKINDVLYRLIFRHRRVNRGTAEHPKMRFVTAVCLRMVEEPYTEYLDAHTYPFDTVMLDRRTKEVGRKAALAKVLLGRLNHTEKARFDKDARKGAWAQYLLRGVIDQTKVIVINEAAKLPGRQIKLLEAAKEVAKVEQVEAEVVPPVVTEVTNDPPTTVVLPRPVIQYLPGADDSIVTTVDASR